MEWFVYNSLKANPDKFQFIVLGKTGSNGSFSLKINDIKIESTPTVLLLGITIDNKLKFTEHIQKLVQNAYYKLYALRRL